MERSSFQDIWKKKIWFFVQYDGGKRDVLVSGIINRGDDYNAKVQKVNEFLSEIRTRKNVKYIDNGKTGLGMLNRSKLGVK